MMQLYVSDMDGTLFSNMAGLPEAEQLRLRLLVDAGLAFTVATARTLPSALQGLGVVVPALPLIINNGALIATADGRVLHEAVIPADQGREVIRVLKDLDSPFVAVPGSEHGHDRWWWKRPGPSTMDLLLATHGDLPDFKPMPEGGLPAGQSWASISCSGPRERMMAVCEWCRATEGIQAVPMTDPYQNGVEVVFIQHAEANKGSALKWLCGHLGADAGLATAFGDGLNDMSLFEAAGYSVATANACPELKVLADATLDPGMSVVDYLEARAGLR